VPDPFGTVLPTRPPTGTAPHTRDVRAAVQNALEPCLTKARALARTVSPARRRAAAGRFAKVAATCRGELAALPDSAARDDALKTLRRHATAAKTLRSQRPSAKAVRSARRALRTG